MKNYTMAVNKKRIFSYLFSFLLALLYSFMDPRVGIPVCIILMILPFPSILSLFLIRDKISTSIQLDEAYVEKNERIVLKIKIQKSTFLPISRVHVLLINDGHMRSKTTNSFLISLPNRAAFQLDKEYRAMFWGVGHIGVKQFSIFDFFGLVSINLKEDILKEQLHREIYIKPSIPTGFLSAYLLAIQFASVSEEEEGDIYSHSMMAALGYEHRAYVPGDSLKRINWKLSAKKDEYLVREYEPLDTNNPLILLYPKTFAAALDYYESVYHMEREERLIEGLLCSLDAMVKQLIESDLFAVMDYHWKDYLIETMDEVLGLQNAMATFRFFSPDEMKLNTYIQQVPLSFKSRVKRGQLVIIFSNVIDRDLVDLIQSLQHGGAVTHVVTALNLSELTLIEADILGNIWSIDEAYEFSSRGTRS